MAAEIILPPIIEKAGENLVAITGRQFGYLIRYKRNSENLKNQVEKLEGRRNDVQGSIDAAKRNGEEILNGVKIWIARVDENMVEAKKFLEDDANVNKRCFLGWFPNLTLRYRLSREATKKTITLIKLVEDGKFDSISNPAPPPGIESISSTDFVTFETTKLAMAKVMEALKKEKTNFIGIHGMGGVGKTTLVTEIAKKAKEDNLFDNVVMAVVSQTWELKKIQDHIAEMLGLKLKDQSDFVRVSRLRARLKVEKRILVILDDVWETVDVKAIGIPLGVDHEGCKMIITTRREQVCSTMDMGNETTEIIPLGVLSEQESWDMLRRNAGDVGDSPMLTDVAKEVARECRGLPIALVTVGRAMRGNDLEGWKEAAKVLKKSMPAKIEGVDQGVVRCLKLSYDYLRDEEAKSCFLLCSLFPEDHDIPIEYLVRYGMGLGIFENVDTINEARGRTRSVINSLKASCLLLASDGEGCIKMHDVVRDVAISIGSDKYLVRAGVSLIEWPKVETLEHYVGISLMYNQISKHPDAWECPNLKILLMQNNCIDQYMPGVFKGMKALRVLDQSSMESSIKLEPSFCCLTNLRTLILELRDISDTSALGEIKTLEILSFADCTFLESTNAIRHLTNLRLLDLSDCSHSSHIPAIIPADVISSLSRLEELSMNNSWFSRASEGSSRNLPSIVELKSLPRLTILTIHIHDLSCIPEDFVFPDLEIFRISIGTELIDWQYLDPNYLGLSGGDRQYEKMSCIKALLGRTNNLSLLFLEGLNNVLPDLLLDRDSLNVLKTLTVVFCDEFEYLINSEELRIPPQAQKHQLRGFYNLEELHLHHLKNFKGICDGVLPLDLSFTKLKKMEVMNCHKLKKMFPLTIARRLEKLEELDIYECEELEEIVAKEHEGQEEGEEVVNKMVFPQLKTLKLSQLSNLNGFCMGSFSFEWPSLERVEVYQCPKMKTFTTAVAADGTQSTPKLKTIKLNWVEMDGLDLNTVIQKHFKEKEVQGVQTLQCLGTTINAMFKDWLEASN